MRLAVSITGSSKAIERAKQIVDEIVDELDPLRVWDDGISFAVLPISISEDEDRDRSIDEVLFVQLSIRIPDSDSKQHRTITSKVIISIDHLKAFLEQVFTLVEQIERAERTAMKSGEQAIALGSSETALDQAQTRDQERTGNQEDQEQVVAELKKELKRIKLKYRTCKMFFILFWIVNALVFLAAIAVSLLF